MKHPDKWLLYAALSGVLLLFGSMGIWSAQPAAAQCGTAASSCKNCHETQAKMPVASKGEWHSAHAFGDFCEFCHAGNVQATEQEAAHQGMIGPLDDVQASCQSCHPTDFADRAQKYGTALGIEIKAGGSQSGGSGGSQSGGPAVGSTAVGAPLGGAAIDFNLLYAEATAAPTLVSNWGNLILGLMTLATAGAFFVTAWSWEGWGKTVAAWIEQNVTPIPRAVLAVSGDGSAAMNQALTAGQTDQLQALLAQKPELGRLLPRLMSCSPETLAALENILANPERGAELLAAVSRVDTEIITTLRQVGAQDRNLLLALVKGMM